LQWRRANPLEAGLNTPPPIDLAPRAMTVREPGDPITLNRLYRLYCRSNEEERGQSARLK
jgi:hypothetical protein